MHMKSLILLGGLTFDDACLVLSGSLIAVCFHLFYKILDFLSGFSLLLLILPRFYSPYFCLLFYNIQNHNLHISSSHSPRAFAIFCLCSACPLFATFSSTFCFSFYFFFSIVTVFLIKNFGFLLEYRGRGSTFKVVGPHNIVTKEVPPWLAPTGKENF